VTSPLLRQLPDTWKTQLSLVLRARIVFTELLPGNALIRYATIFKIAKYQMTWMKHVQNEDK
jgi:hypothetical protein